MVVSNQVVDATHQVGPAGAIQCQRDGGLKSAINKGETTMKFRDANHKFKILDWNVNEHCEYDK